MNPLSLNVPIELLQKQYEQSSDAIIFFDAQHRIMAMNPQAEKLAGSPGAGGISRHRAQRFLLLVPWIY